MHPPQWAVVLVSTQVPLQSVFIPQVHVPCEEHVFPPEQSELPTHWTQFPLLHNGAAVPVHDRHVMPSALQVAGWEMLTQAVPPQSPCPAGHLQVPFMQLVPPVHALPQVPQLALSEFLSTQLVPHNAVVLSQAVPQTLAVQVATLWAPVAVQSEAEQQAGAEILMHVVLPVQVCCPLGHIPLQAAFCAIHTPLQFCGRVAGQVWTQAVPLQVTAPPVGALQALVHSVRPQVAGALLLTQVPPQLW